VKIQLCFMLKAFRLELFLTSNSKPMLRDRKREKKKLKSIVSRNEDANVIPLLRDLRFMNHIVSGAAACDRELHERTAGRSAWRPMSSTDLLGIPLRSESIIGRQLATLFRVYCEDKKLFFN